MTTNKIKATAKHTEKGKEGLLLFLEGEQFEIVETDLKAYPSTMIKIKNERIHDWGFWVFEKDFIIN